MDIEKICMGCMREITQKGECCTYCGYRIADASHEENIHHLKPYSILAGKYLVGKVLGEGGFGITYIGLDLNLEMKVAIKEFYPNGFVTREGTVTSMVTEYAGTSQQAVKKWKEGFIREARILAKCSNLSGIVGVKDFFQENNTAYIIMEYLEGETLKEHLKKIGGKMPVQEVISLMRPVITSLSKMHELGMIHRDISPDNIIIQSDGSVKLLDFGAARDYASEEEKSLSVLLKPGYAPEEQYRTKGKQGPWSDVYALCATIYKCITGITPLESMERMREDCLQKPKALGIPIAKELEECILKGMEVYSENRIQNMNELYSGLYNSDINPKIQTQSREEGLQLHEQSKETGVAENVNTSKNEVISVINQHLGKKIGMTAGLIICFFLIIGIVGICGKKMNLHQTEKQRTDEGSGYVVPEKKKVEVQTLTSEEEEAAYQLYESIVEQMVETNTLPEIEGEVTNYHNNLDELYAHDYYVAIQDVDMDGVKELVFLFRENDCDTMKERQIVYKYDAEKKSVHLELDLQQSGVFYDNGTFQYVDQNLCGIYSNEAPVVVMMYDYEKEKYEYVGEFVKWSKKEFPETIVDGKFPNENDADQDGILYNGMQPDGNSTGFVLNEKDYQMWEKQYFDNASILDISYSKISIDEEGSETGADINSYELIIGDVSWSEAYQECISRGGHLLRIESEEEYQEIIKRIDESGLNGYVFWLGGVKDQRDGYVYRWIRNDGSFLEDVLNDGNYLQYWMEGEPSYYDDAGNEEACMDMFYLKKEGRWVWNDVPDNILAIASFYSGRIAYICEYED